MTVAYVPQRVQYEDANGKPYSGARLFFYQAGTTTPLAVYTDAARTVPHAVPVVADSTGTFPVIYLPDQLYKTVLQTSAGVTIRTDDNLDPGIGLGSGALPIAAGGTGATTAANARTNLGAASAASVTTLATDVATLNSTIAGYPTFGALAALNTVDTATITTPSVAQVVRATDITAYTTITANIPYDDTIPQVTEGAQQFSISITPLSASHRLVVRARFVFGASGGSGTRICFAVFRNGAANAVFAQWETMAATNVVQTTEVVFEVLAGSTAATTFTIRVGADTGNTFLNGGSVSRIGGGVTACTARIEEWKGL